MRRALLALVVLAALWLGAVAGYAAGRLDVETPSGSVLVDKLGRCPLDRLSRWAYEWGERC